jgi:hypothetical protein
MKKLFFPAFALLALAIVFTGCNTNSPKDAAQKWLTSFYHMDYETAKKYSTEDTKKLLMTLEQLSALSNDSVKQQMKQLKVEIKDVKEKGDTAMVSYTLSDTPKEQKVKLIKIQGKWLVAKSKQDDMGDDNGNDQPAAGPDSTTAPMPVDSTAAPK